MELAFGVQHQGRQISGIEFLINRLEERFGLLEQELQIHVLRDMLGIYKQQSESIDECINRFGIVCLKADEGANIKLPPRVLSRILLNGLGIGPKEWPQILFATRGALPVDAQQFRELAEYLRRRGHLTDNSSHTDPAKQFRNNNFFSNNASADGAMPVFHAQQQQPHQPAFGASSSSFPSFSGPSFADHDASINADDESFSEASSGHSHDEEAISLDDLQGLDMTTAAEQLYL